MVAFHTLVTSFVFAASAVLAEPLSSGALYARQLSGIDPSQIPPACQSTCGPLYNTLTNGGCTDLQCLCTNTIVNGIKGCLECGLKVNVPGLNQTVVDQTISGFVDACNQGGVPVSVDSSSSPTTTSGTGSGNGGSSTSGGSSASSATNTASSNPSTQKNGAIADYSISILGSVFVIAMSGFALF